MNADNKTEYRILLADDDPISQLLLKKVLEKSGFVIETVGDGRKVIERLEAAPFDLVVLDGDMPVLDGFETAALIRQNDRLRGLRIILLSGQSIGEKNTSDFDYALAKPISPSELLATIQKTATLKLSV